MSSTKVVFVGGSIAGLGALNGFIQTVVKNGLLNHELDLILLEPRAGFINPLALPKSIIDANFAREIYFDIERYNLRFDQVESLDQQLVNRLTNKERKPALEIPENLKLRYIQGRCVKFKDNNNLTYQLVNSKEIKPLAFDYCVFATGRKRSLPFDPVGTTKEQFLEEMAKVKVDVEKASHVTIIGGGGLGIEVAGEIKQDYPSKSVTLIHPHGILPPEQYASTKFKQEVAKAIKKIGIDLKLNTRIAKQLENGDLLTTTNETIKSELNYWCTSHKNNIDPLLPFFKDSIDPKTNEVLVATNYLINGFTNVFAAGDIVHLPIVKTAGAASRGGKMIGRSLYNILVRGKEEYETIDLENVRYKMTFVVGNRQTISQRSNEGEGVVDVNDERSLESYKDYGNWKAKSRILNLAPNL